jgi:short-subunit dehydrogenase
MIQVGVLCPGPVQTPFFGNDDPANHFPSPILQEMLDTVTVAKHCLKLIDKPRIKVIPRKLKWALKLQHLMPRVYFWVTQNLYRRLLQKEEVGHQFPIS